MFSEECKNLEQFLKDTCGPSFILITDPYLYNQSFMGVRLFDPGTQGHGSLCLVPPPFYFTTLYHLI